MKNKLPSKPRNFESIIVNLDNDFGNGTHWVAIKKLNNYALYFDSYGNLNPPLEIVKYLGTNTIIKYNSNTYQPYNTIICGHLCLAFLL